MNNEEIIKELQKFSAQKYGIALPFDLCENLLSLQEEKLDELYIARFQEQKAEYLEFLKSANEILDSQLIRTEISRRENQSPSETPRRMQGEESITETSSGDNQSQSSQGDGSKTVDKRNSSEKNVLSPSSGSGAQSPQDKMAGTPAITKVTASVLLNKDKTADKPNSICANCGRIEKEHYENSHGQKWCSPIDDYGNMEKFTPKEMKEK